VKSKRSVVGSAYGISLFSRLQLGSAGSAHSGIKWFLCWQANTHTHRFSTGGGHDLEARVLARHLSKHIPGNPRMIVQNMPGAGGVLMTSYLHNRAKADGLTFAVVGRTQILFAILEKVDFDLARMPLIWGISGTNVDLVRGDLLKVNTFKDLLNVDPTQIAIGGRSRSDTSCLSGRLAMDLLGIKGYKAVCAYQGTAPIRAAM